MEVLTKCLSVDVIATTTTACAMYWDKLKKLELKILICEEAAEVLEAQLLSTLFPSIEHCLSIGDPLQLRYVLRMIVSSFCLQ